MTRTRTLLAILSTTSLAVGLAACESSGDDPRGPDLGSSAELRAPQTCDELLSDIQADALAKIEMQTEQYLDWYASEGGYGRAGGLDAAAGAEADDSGSRSEGPESYSETNTQVEGVDEADIVKTDGEHIYVLSGNQLHILDSWPAEETSLETSFELDGYAHEMFVAEGRAVVFSQTADPRIPPDEDTCGREYEDRGYYYPCYSYGSQFTKVTVVDLNEGEPRLSREVWFEGYYRTSRRHDTQVRAVLNNWSYYLGYDLPNVWEYLYPESDYDRELSSIEARARIYRWRHAAIAAAYARALEDWLPDAVERVEGTLTELPVDCASYYVTRPGLVDYGMTQVVGVHLTDGSAPVTRTGVWGLAHEVYSGAETLVLAQRDYSAWWRAWYGDEDEVSDRTLLHQFTLSADGRTLYDGSGMVPGTIIDQFSMDVRDGVLRVATTETTWRVWREDREWVPPTTENRVLTLEGGENGLYIVGATPALAEGERIFSTRFMGDRAYVVTFEQVDPLWVIDLSNPHDLEVLGELHIPGFSNYMHPLDEDHLLTIGRDADEDGTVRGLALQIFDVSDEMAPTLDHKIVFADRWGYSEAAWDHKAFTFYDHLGLLAFPYLSWGSDWDSYHSSLEVFEVDAEAGFRPVGSIDHTALLDGICATEGDRSCRYYGLNVRRGVFIEDYVYSISHGGVRVHRVDDMSTEVATVRLPR